MDDLQATYLSRMYDAPLGHHERGEIEIVTDPAVLNGAFLEWARAHGRTAPYIGIVYEDDYVAVVRDAVRFPAGNLGDYIRVLAKPLREIPDGVIIAPLRGARMGFVRMYRHALRAWSLELPRGGAEPAEPLEDAAHRELLQETGLRAERLARIGVLSPDTGLLATSVAVFVAEVELPPDQEARPEESEALGEILWLDRGALGARAAAGEIRDGLTLGAVQLVEACGAWGV